METIKILGINGSNRRGGNSRFLLDQALAAAALAVPGCVDTEIYETGGRTYLPCTACDRCHSKLGVCRLEDDFAELRDKWLEADALIYSVPVYHAGIPGHLKCFIDRLGESVVEGFFSKQMKVVGCVTSGTGIATGQESVMNFINAHAMMLGCLPFAGEWPGAYTGAGGWTHVDPRKNALKDLHAGNDETTAYLVKSTRNMAAGIAQLAVLIKTGARQKQVHDLLEKSGRYTMFLRRISGTKPLAIEKPYDYFATDEDTQLEFDED
ncbi:flavodoxin family protein [uncultured Desulfobacter sp.]|uniref:flavodoxin family protein n=1 Tax=uncultured Desulfobacter sp. TaxID=240139 RepID=UPI002AAC0F0C|nr:flavodoxin family protein [uncultured Desulfobacter sp.]